MIIKNPTSGWFEEHVQIYTDGANPQIVMAKPCSMCNKACKYIYEKDVGMTRHFDCFNAEWEITPAMRKRFERWEKDVLWQSRN